MTGSEWDRTSHCYEVQKKQWRRLGDAEYSEKEYWRLRKRLVDPVFQDNLQQQRRQRDAKRQKAAEDAEHDAELLRADNIFLDLLNRANLLPFFYEDPLYFDRPRVPSFLAEPINKDEPLGPSRPWRPSREELREAKRQLHEHLVDSADFLELLRLPSDEASEEFVYMLSEGCALYIDFVHELGERGAPFGLPPDDEAPSAAAISRPMAGRQPRVSPGEEGAPSYWDGDDSRLTQTQKRDCFPVAAAERLQKACFGWLYDHALHVMACLDRHWDDGDDDELYCMPDGSRRDSSNEAQWCMQKVWRWQVEARPSREEVLRTGGLRADHRGITPGGQLRGMKGLCAEPSVHDALYGVRIPSDVSCKWFKV